ncbi:thiamine pyrophosphate-binding protein [Saccharopolyspora sp. ASAGF58]|uniref:thiamine pyrophosphate-binding protein n=1 Tax=Saccharopolyspora sp. ASAGF58 TaxID=2719023 RepID=UPI001B3065C8|nr:thiamine pyrophosphate-binding protein [Saccharopolyspora sp. ASAGF58]
MTHSPRHGGDLVVETLGALGADTVFGIPGQHALALFDALGRSSLSFVSARVENNAAFAADGYARATGEVGVLFVSTGPGALTSLAGLQEAYSAGVPMVVVASQVPLRGLGGARRGMLHQLDDQQASARNVCKSTHLVRRGSHIPSVLQQAWVTALTAPQGPVWVEIPQDVLLAPANIPPVRDIPVAVPALLPRDELVETAADWLQAADRPVILAGGGARRSGASEPLMRLAEALRAPVVSTAGGKGVFPWGHPLSAQSWVEDGLTTELLDDADVLLVVGSALGEVTSNYFTLAPRGRIIQIDAHAAVLESNHPALGIHADAAGTLAVLAEQVRPRPSNGYAEGVVQKLLAGIQARLDTQPLAAERRLMEDLRDAVPPDTNTFWDMTIAAYWAWSCWDSRAGQFQSAQAAGGLGFGLPAALGAALGTEQRTLAVSGDGSAMYSIAELATAVQHRAPVTWLIVDDGGYGILREYMTATFDAPSATELSRPDYVALAESFGIPATKTTLQGVGAALRAALASEGPNVVVLNAVLAMFEPTTPAPPTASAPQRPVRRGIRTSARNFREGHGALPDGPQ